MYRPLAFFWSSRIPGGSYSSNSVVPYTILVAPDVVIDIAILVGPLPMTWNLRFALADKVALLCIFETGVW